jgi:hypothetical protein
MMGERPSTDTFLPTVPFGPYAISRLIVGGNPFCANSHVSRELSAEMGEYYTDERVVETLLQCEAAGINTCQVRGDYRVLNWIETLRRRGSRMQVIYQTASEMHDVFQNIRVLAATDPIGIYHHGTRTDQLWLEGRIEEARDYLKCMRDCGVRVGLGTHLPEVVEYAEEHDWDLDFYMSCFYTISHKPRESALVSGVQGVEAEVYLGQDRARMCAAIARTEKQCLAFKILAAGRNCGTQDDVRAAFDFAFTQIKPTDAVVVGMFTRDLDQVALNAAYARGACEAALQGDAA